MSRPMTSESTPLDRNDQEKKNRTSPAGAPDRRAGSAARPEASATTDDSTSGAWIVWGLLAAGAVLVVLKLFGLVG